MARRMMAVATSLTVFLMTAQVSPFAQAGTGTISGTATNQNGQALANTTAQLRDVTTKQLVGTTITNAQGGFAFVGLNPGQFVVEIIGPNGAIVGTTAPITLAAGAMAVTGVAVTATALGAIAGGAAAAGGVGSFFGTTAGIITGVAIAGGITAGVLAATNDASPSR
jgi:hypothetical protein